MKSHSSQATGKDANLDEVNLMRVRSLSKSLMEPRRSGEVRWSVDRVFGTREPTLFGRRKCLHGSVARNLVVSSPPSLELDVEHRHQVASHQVASRNRGIRRSGRLLSHLGVLVAIAICAATTSASEAAASTTYNPYGTWNGYRIYLSPSSQSNAGCKSYLEKTGMMDAAESATDSPFVNGTYYATPSQRSNLRARGYRVRIGTGTVADRIADSNVWGADVHIPLHSNAPGGTYSCSSTSTSGKGTMVMYYSTNGKNLATQLKSQIGSASPGTSDKICTDTACSGQSLGELRNTDGIAAYAEVEYHTWNIGVDWVRSSWTQWGWRVGAAVDQYLGYPR